MFGEFFGIARLADSQGNSSMCAQCNDVANSNNLLQYYIIFFGGGGEKLCAQ